MSEWQGIETAPKGEITEDAGCRGSSEWFTGLRKDGAEMKIRRLPTMHSFDFRDDEETYYASHWFTHWKPIQQTGTPSVAA